MNNIITEFSYKTSTVSNRSSDFHLHKGYQIILVTDGYVDMQIEERFYTIEAPSIVILNTFEQHSLKNATPDYTRYVVELNPILTENMLDYNIINMLKLRPSEFRHTLKLDSNQLSKFLDVIHNIQLEYNDNKPLYNLVINAEITKLLVDIFRIFPYHNDVFSNQITLGIRQFIDANYADKITVACLAKKFFISSSYLSHLFKTYSGYSVKQYLIFTRLYNAQFLLTNTKNTIRNISLLCGYSDTNNFIRQFRVQYLMSPLQYRKKSQQN